MGLFSKNSEKSFLNAIEGRRTVYNLKESISISDEELEQIMTQAIKHVPPLSIHNQHALSYY